MGSALLSHSDPSESATLCARETSDKHNFPNKIEIKKLACFSKNTTNPEQHMVTHTKNSDLSLVDGKLLGKVWNTFFPSGCFCFSVVAHM